MNPIFNEMLKEAADMQQNGFEYGYRMYHLFKAAAEGDPMAQQTIDQATQAAAADAGAAEAAPEAAPAPEGDGTAPGTIGPAGMMVCPNCGTQMTPTLELTCPACGFNVQEVLAQAATQAQSPAPSGGEVSTDQVPAEAVADTANQVKEAALRDPDFMQMLINTYGGMVR
jgi:hypothetical protein